MLLFIQLLYIVSLAFNSCFTISLEDFSRYLTLEGKSAPSYRAPWQCSGRGLWTSLTRLDGLQPRSNGLQLKSDGLLLILAMTLRQRLFGQPCT